MESDAERIERAWSWEPHLVAICPADSCPPVGAHLVVGRDADGRQVGMWLDGQVRLHEERIRETGECVSRDGVSGTIIRVNPVRPAPRYEAWILYLRLDVPG